jgi:hypothetical protein
MDLAKLTRSITPWATLVANWHKGKQIDRNEVIRLLESGKPIPLEANEFLAKALANEVKFKRGNKPSYPPQSAGYAKLVVATVDFIEAIIKNPETIPDGDEYKEGRADFIKMNQRATRKRAKRTSARQQAKDEVAKMFGISVRRVESLITERNRELKRLANHFGVTVAEVKAALE